MKTTITDILALVLLLATAATAGYPEDWDTDPPGSNDWFYFHEVPGQPQAGSIPMVWVPAGGQGNGLGYVECPLDDTTQWSEITSTRNYWPGYTLNDHHPIDLNTDPVIKVSLKDTSVLPAAGTLLPGDANGDGVVNDLDLTTVAVHWQQATGLWEHGDFDGSGTVDDLDLTALAVNWQRGAGTSGGGIYFWIGEWTDPDGPTGPLPPKLSFFYFDSPLAVGPDWTQNTLLINPSNWVVLREDQGKMPADLFANPQQWGFGIFGGTSDPTGALGFDSFVNIPEPATMIFLAAGAVVAMRPRRGR